MEVYLLVPSSPSATSEITELCRRLFSAKKEKVEIHSSTEEACVSVAKELAVCIGMEPVNEKCSLIADDSILIFVLTLQTAYLVAKNFDPGYAPSINLDALVRLKDTRKIFPERK